MNNNDTGLLLNEHNIKLQRQWFKEMTKLHGIKVIYKAPREDKTYDMYGELETNYYEPIITNCIFEEYPTQRTMKKLGWDSILSDENSIIHVSYDLQNLQVGALFIIPSALDNSEGRVFKVIRMSTIAIYPASITCEIGPMWESEFEKSQLHNFEKTNFNLLNEGDKNK